MSTAAPPTTDPVSVARETAEELLDGALAADDPARGVRRATLRLLADRGLYSVAAPVDDGGLGGDDRTLGAVEELLAGADGATWFVMTQHRTAQKLGAAPDGGPAAERHRRALATGDALAGIAVAHLRRPGTPVRAVPDPARSGGWRFSGHSDWCTGWGLVDLVLVGARTDDDRVVFALVEARPRPGLVATEPLPLAVMGGTRTVALDLDDVAITADEVALVVDGATWRARDAGTVLDAKPANLGLLARLLAETDRVGRGRGRPEAVDAAAALGAEAGPLRDRAVALRHAPDAADHAEERVALRGRLAELTHRAAGGLVVARGGSAMLSSSHEQRWLREAGFHLVQAQTDAVRAAQLEAFVSRA